jgi:hypothetical protein
MLYWLALETVTIEVPWQKNGKLTHEYNTFWVT